MAGTTLHDIASVRRKNSSVKIMFNVDYTILSESDIYPPQHHTIIPIY